MDTDTERSAGLKRLFGRCKDVAIRNGNGIVVPSKVVDELYKQSSLDASLFTEERAAAVHRAGQWLTALESGAAHGLIRKDLGDGSNPYADDLFVDLFTHFSDQYDMCLLTNDITLRLRIRLLASEAKHQLVAGTVCADGRIALDADRDLYERAARKLARITRHIEEGLAKPKDYAEVQTLAPLLETFRHTFGVTDIVPKLGGRRDARVETSSAPQPADGAFKRVMALKPKDQLLLAAVIPSAGASVIAESQHSRHALVLGDLIGEGGEGSVYAVQGDKSQVVKIFDKDHRTEHRKAKLELLISHELGSQGIGFPTNIVTNSDGNFVGYAMPRASGKELQATIMRPARFRRVYPTWTKADLVDVCVSFLEKVAYLHSLNILLGDINPKNLMVDEHKNVWIIDADSWQVEGYPCPVGTAMFTASSITGDYADVLRTVEEERFAVATMLFMILITGQFPYARAGADGGDFAALIKEGKFAFQFQGPSDQDQPEGSWKFMWSHIPVQVKRLFWNTFQRQGGSRYDRRPTASEWLAAFREYRNFFGGNDDFDPMSNDVYPFRFRAYRPDTPIRDCQQCKRPNAIVGRWDDENHSYYEPSVCYDCNQSKSRCTDCGKPKSADALTDGRCHDCNRIRNFATCDSCSREVARIYLVDGQCSNCQPVPCKDCKTPSAKTELTYGRCGACVKKAAELNPKRLCLECRQPFITFDHERWFISKGLDIPKSHQTATKKPCPPRPTTARSSRTATRSATASTTPAAPAKKSSWQRFVTWLSS
ncbi:hypothetical protein [Cryobacterium sp. SO1]|uniref:protein kinase domain-containing protein n=1 Tax=Cryobacterium sp. SO1 TaxID=1897061 RepID=UPI0010D39328|nr:hypothetical protein [Cryobacterium sp. SO1]RZI35794.1 hypothetical protein BJQ95_01821 [Cryobacterium sp. SO1]